MIVRLWGRLVDGLGALGSMMIAGLMALIVADVVVRNAFNVTIPIVAEVGALGVVMILFLQLATTVRHERMARTEFVIQALFRRSPAAAAFMEGIYDLLGALACGLIAWSTYGVLIKDLAAGEFIGVLGLLTIPVWPFRVLIMIGVGVAAVHYLCRGVGRVLGVGRPAS
jgi:TRAP-type mannitol/chloroaromatic compound transport system permease small subunit